MKLHRDEMDNIDLSAFPQFENGAHFAYYALEESVPEKFNAKLKALGYIRQVHSLEWIPEKLDEVEALAQGVVQSSLNSELDKLAELGIDSDDDDDIDYCGTYIVQTVQVLRTLTFPLT